jgi:hypothetical protein
MCLIFVISGGGKPVSAARAATSGLLFSTFFPGRVDAIAVDGAGNVYIAGAATASTPTTDGTTFDTGFSIGTTFAAKLDPTGSRIIYSTIFQSSMLDVALAVDAQGNLYITGQESPFNSRAVITRTFGPDSAGSYSPVIKLDPSGHTAYHVRVGGSQQTEGLAIAVDGLGNVFVTGWTSSPDYPRYGTAGRTWAGGTGSTPHDAFVFKLNADAGFLAYSTFLGGSGQDEAHGIAVDASGNAYVAGSTTSANFPTTSGAFQTTAHGAGDLFVTKLDPQGNALVYSTFLGGSGSEGGFFPQHDMLAVDAAGNAFVVGVSGSTDYPTTSNATQRTASGNGVANDVISELNDTGTALLYSSYLGGSAENTATALALGDGSRIYVGGRTSSADFPVTPNAFQSEIGNVEAGTISVIDPQTGALLYSTFITASDSRSWAEVTTMTADAHGDVYFGGPAPPEFPTTPGSYQPASSTATDFVAKLVPETDLAFSRPVTSSSDYSAEFGPANAVDATYSTRWSSQFSDPQWLAIDLGSTFNLTRVVLHWETAYASGYEIQLSSDGTSWTTAASVSGGDGGLDDVAISGTGRYLRMYGTQRATQWGYSLWEVETYGTPAGGGSNVAPSVTLTSPVNGTTMTAPASVTVSANASDTDGTVARVDLYQGSTKIASITTPPYSTAVSGLGVGTYTFSAVATDNAGASTTSASATITVNTSTGGALPSPWQDVDVKFPGFATPPGSASYSNGVFTINGTGYGIGENNDFGHYVYQSAGDTDLVARVTTVQNTGTAAGAGVMWRETTNASAAEVSLIVRPNGNVDMLARATGGSSYTQLVTTVPATFPVWLKLARTDPWFNAYVSADGANWTFAGSIRVAMSGALAGIIGVAGDGTRTNTSTFDHVAVGGSSSGSGTLSPFSGTPVAVPGQILAANFDNGGEGVAYHDTTSGNTGGAYRNTDVDIEASSDGGNAGNDIGWIDAGEWLNYTVNVTQPGNYTVQLRVASPDGGASLHVGFNGPSQGQWQAVSVLATGGWQNWTTVNVPVTLAAGIQQMTIYFDTAGLNFLWANVGP